MKLMQGSEEINSNSGRCQKTAGQWSVIDTGFRLASEPAPG